MRLITGNTNSEKPVPSVVTIGKFDGFHQGHRKLLGEVEKYKEKGLRTVVFSFDMSPQAFMDGREMRYLLGFEEKCRMAEQLGIDLLVEYPFTAEVRHMTADIFLKEVLIGQLGMKAIVAGPDCGFGYQRQGNIDFLAKNAEKEGYELKVVDKMNFEGSPIGSSRIRRCVESGRVEKAASMLGYRFSYSGEILHGYQIGRTLGIPTINVKIPEDKLISAYGVYATMTEIDGRRWYGMSNVGVKPTIEGTHQPAIETNLFDFDGDIYGRNARIYLMKHIRPEVRFASLDALKNQVKRDKTEISRWFHKENLTKTE